MKSLLICVALAVILCACRTTYRSEFIDVDGTSFTSELCVAPFGRVDETIAQLQYEWQDGSGTIAVGQKSAGASNEGQIEALARMLESIERLAQKGSEQ